MPRILAASGGFLLAVLWMDLMFDVQVLPHEGLRSVPLPEGVLTSIAVYYRHVATEAVPMRHLVSLVILVTIGGSFIQAFQSGLARWRRVLPVLLSGTPSVWAAFRILPNAARLGSRIDPPAVQSALAFTIFHDHVVCFLAIAAFVVIQLFFPNRLGKFGQLG
jgi:hypothetical protein